MNDTDAGAAVVLRCADRWGRVVILTAAQWRGHTLAQRSYLAPRLDALVATLTDPTRVRYDATNADRECFSRAAILPLPFAHLDLKVVVAFGPAGGTVITAYPTGIIKRTEVQNWP